MPAPDNLRGQTFGELTVLSRAPNNSLKQTMWRCRCLCGKIVVVAAAKLKRGTRFSCNSRTHVPKPRKGAKFGKLTIVAIVGLVAKFGSRRRLTVRASCECGGEWTGPFDSLRKGNTASCGCMRRGPVPDKDRQQSAMRRVLRNYKRHAKRRGLRWLLTEERFAQLAVSNCSYCGAPPTMVAREKAGGLFIYNGIDRLDNTRGYLPDNVVPACNTCNLAKQGLSRSEFLAHVAKIYNYANNRKD
jgi:hypothetical protein